MSPLWLANAEPATAWSHQTWSDLSARPDKARTLVILPVHGFADHGLGLPLDTEETVGSAVLRAAVIATGAPSNVLVLPPLRLVAAPYAHSRFGVDAETVLDSLAELTASVKASGFSRILFFNTSPWNVELVNTAALDARVALDLRTYVIGSAGIGLGFHPTHPHLQHTQTVAARLLGHSLAPNSAALNATTAIATSVPTDVRDADFRPGYFGQPAPVTPDASLDGESLFLAAAAQLASLLGEILVHATTSPFPSAPASPLFAPAAVPSASRARQLTTFTAAELAAIPDKAGALVILPTGAIEQHGHHLPLGTDAFLGQLWLNRALPKLPANSPVFVSPPLTFGKSNEHLGFAGTLTLSARTLRRQVTALVTDLYAQGFRQVAVLNTHGGNSATLVTTVRELQTALSGLRIGLLSGYYKPAQTPQEAAYGFHAGEWETALLLSAAPELVRMDRAVCEYPAQLDAPGALRPEAAPAIFAWKTSDISKSGVMGDATLATAEKGARWLDEASTALARRIESLLNA